MPRFALLILILCMALSALDWAGFDEGVAFSEREDYATARREF